MVGLRTYPCKDSLFKEWSELGMYWLGFCATDGYVQGTSLQLHISRKDRGALDALKVALETEHPIYDRIHQGYETSALYVSSRELCSAVSGFGRSNILDCPEDVAHHLVRGVFDANGHIWCKDYRYDGVDVYHRQVEICGKEGIMSAVRDVVMRFAGTTKGCIYPRKKVVSWMLSGKRNLKKFGDWLYKDATVYLDRKKTRFQF